MKTFPLMCVVALLGATVSLPAQVSVVAQFGRSARVHASVHNRVDPYFGRSVRQGCEPVRCQPVRRDAFWCEPARPVIAPRGHWEERCEQVLVPASWREEHVPPTYGWVRTHCGHLEWGIVDPGGCRQVLVPAHYESRTRRVWVSC